MAAVKLEDLTGKYAARALKGIILIPLAALAAVFYFVLIIYAIIMMLCLAPGGAVSIEETNDGCSGDKVPPRTDRQRL